MKDKQTRGAAFFRDRDIKPSSLLLVLLALAVVLVGGLFLDHWIGGGEQAFPVYISEVLASNTGYPNEEGRCCDYIEVHNGADYAVDLSGFQLGDIAGKTRYFFPAGTVLQPGDYLLVNCDGGVENAAYAPFDISRAGGEDFYLIAKNSAIVDSVTTIAMDVDQSMCILRRPTAAGAVTNGS